MNFPTEKLHSLGRPAQDRKIQAHIFLQLG